MGGIKNARHIRLILILLYKWMSFSRNLFKRNHWKGEQRLVYMLVHDIFL